MPIAMPCALAAALLAVAQPLVAQTAALDSIARAAVAAGKAPGMAVVVLRGGDTLLARGYGLADVERRTPVRPTSVFRIGSITKQFTAAGVMQLVAAGRVRLTDSLARYVPELDGGGRDATLHELLSHTSGLANMTELPAFRALARRDLTVRDVVSLVADQPLRFPNGARWAYNNTGYYLLGIVLERVSGEPYATYVSRRLAGPLGLHHTAYCTAAPSPDDVTGYDVEDGKLERVERAGLATPFAAGGLCASALDVAAWTRALAAGRVVPPERYRRMTTPVALPDGHTAQYGYGLEITELGGQRRIGHGGSIAGFDGYAAHYPESALTVVVLTNNGSANAEAIEKSLARRALGVAANEPAEVAVAEAELARYVGTYQAGPGRVQVTVRNARLHVQGPVDADLRHIGADTFVLAEEPDVTLAFQGAGRASAIAWTSRGRTLTLPRIP